MQTISTIKGKLFFFARHLASSKRLTSGELSLLKDLIISNNPQVVAAYQNYVKSGTELTLASQLIQIVHLQKDNSTDSTDSRVTKKSKRNAISVIIPKKMIQKLPTDMERL